MWLGSTFNGIPLPPQNMWQSKESGETKTLAAWADGYVLRRNPDGSLTATTKFSNGIPPLTLVKLAGPNQHPFAADSERPIPTNRQKSWNQWWERPDDVVITTGTCQNMTQTDSCVGIDPQEYRGELSYSQRPQAWKDAKLACESNYPNNCGDWTETYELIDNSGKLWSMDNDRPEKLPRGWRVDSGGHLTNLPAELNVTASTALPNNVAIIRPVSKDGVFNTKTGEYTRMEWELTVPCIYHTNPVTGQFSKEECEALNYGTTKVYSDHLSWVIGDGKKAQTVNLGDDRFYWWLESPTFTTACSDPTDSTYNLNAHYWDDSKCSSNSSSGSGGSNDSSNNGVSWGPLIAAATSIVVLTAGVTIYGGKL